jgi:hypothetical protein
MISSEILTLRFLPWCRLDREHSAGPVTLVPFSSEQPPEKLDPKTIQAVSAILTNFIGVDDRPVSRCTLVSVEGRVLIEGLVTPAAVSQTIYDHVQMACLSSLEGREYLGPSEPYCNSECFALYGRQYREGPPGAPPILRRDGTPTWLAGRALRVHMPGQTVAVPRVALNEPLYRALAELRRRKLDGNREHDWWVWAESIYSFNLANTDREGMGDHMEWVLMCSAIERLLKARSSASDVAARVAGALFSRDPSASRIVCEWAEEFYRLRGDFAHGRLRTRQPRAWNSPCHLLLGAIAFPLLVKNLLAREGLHRPTENDHCEVGAFARFAADLRDPGSRLKSWHQYMRDEQPTVP